MILTWSLGHLLFYDVSINWLNLNKGFASWAKFKIEFKCAAFKAHAMWQLCAAMMSWVGCYFTNRLSATRYMKVKRMGITEIL